jgi:hypothetical protein
VIDTTLCLVTILSDIGANIFSEIALEIVCYSLTCIDIFFILATYISTTTAAITMRQLN